MGSFCSVMNNTNGTMFCKYGANLDALSIALTVVGELAELIPGIGLGIAIVAEEGEAAIQILHLQEEAAMNAMKGSVEKWFTDRGYSARGPNSDYVSEKVSLSLVMSAYCATLTDVGGGTLELRIGTMTTWSGPGANDVNRYNVTSCEWAKITHPINTGGQAIAGLMDDVGEGQPRVNLAEDKELMAQVREQLAVKGQTFDVKPGKPGSAPVPV